MSQGMWLRFRRHGSKWYAETPAGEYAFGDQQGLYEWRRIDGRLERIDHTGGDRSHVIHGQMTRPGQGGNGGPKLRGFAAAVSNRRVN
jgi:hypothetical protein